MAEAEPEKQQRQQRVGGGSSILRKPFSDLTNLIPKPHRHSISTSSSQAKKPITSTDPTMSLSRTGSTQIHSLVQQQFTAPRDQHPLPTPRTPSPVTLNLPHTQKRRYDSVGDGKHISYTGSQTLMKTRSKTKADAIPVYPIHLERTINNMKSIPMPPRYPLMENTINMEPLSGVKFNNKKKAVMGSSLTDLSKKYEEKMVATPINRYEVNGAEDSLESKSTKVHFPNNKKRRHSSKKSCKKFVLPQDFIDQQRAYFKEIDEYELQVEEEADEISS
ncbi:unnamed protein product [Lactuca saligna]|uniref:Sororin C-terminal region domain-containing protein n=1 Tax=Lactuca saligna TaxID=75948 RepID=A0AA35YH43_LACSI|nr:unnamed protein product [Lactuca saligna]